MYAIASKKEKFEWSKTRSENSLKTRQVTSRVVTPNLNVHITMAPTRSQRYSNKKNNQPGPSQVPLLEDAEDDGIEEAEENMDEDVVGNAESVSVIQSCNIFRPTIIDPLGSTSKSRRPRPACALLRAAPHCLAPR